MFTGGCIFSSRCLLQQPEHVFVLHIRLREHGLCGFGEDVGADVFCQLPRHVRIAQRRVAGLDVRDLRHEIGRCRVEAARLRADGRIRVQQVFDGLVDVFEERIRFFARIDGVVLVERQEARRIAPLRVEPLEAALCIVRAVRVVCAVRRRIVIVGRQDVPWIARTREEN